MPADVSRGDFILEPPSAPLAPQRASYSLSLSRFLSLSHPMRCANQMFLL